jgi:hypothetical protein
MQVNFNSVEDNQREWQFYTEINGQTIFTNVTIEVMDAFVEEMDEPGVYVSIPCEAFEICDLTHENENCEPVTLTPEQNALIREEIAQYINDDSEFIYKEYL